MEPSIMNFTPDPITSPRALTDSDEEEDNGAPKPFPFEFKNPVTEQQQPIYGENEFPDASQTSDSLLRTAMTIADILSTEDIHKDAAQTLLNLPNSIDTSNSATLLMGAKSKSPPGKG
jgi:hypothetical protein